MIWFFKTLWTLLSARIMGWLHDAMFPDCPYVHFDEWEDVR